MTIQRRRGPAAILAIGLSATVLLSACSQEENRDASDLVAEKQAADYRAQQAAQQQINKANAALPDRPSGRVDIDGTTTFSLTQDEVDLFNATGSSTTAVLRQNNQDQAFQELCSGKIDVVNADRPISRSEWEACQAVGLDVVQFQIASDGIVVAIQSESDVGGDCLTTDQVQEIWRAGSPITNWKQLGLDDTPLEVGGPSQRSFPLEFDAFGNTVLGSPAPSQTDLRSDYFSYDRFNQARSFLDGGLRDQRVAQTYAEKARQLGLRKSEMVTAKQVLVDARLELQTAAAERAKGIRDKRSAADQAKDVARLDAARVARTKAAQDYQAAQQRYRRAQKVTTKAANAKRTVERSIGHVIYARFSSYELFEEDLRPFEITEPDGHRNCVFPSQTTISNGDYPLSSQVLLTTTTRALERAEVVAFLKHYLNNSQDAANSAAMIALPDETLRIELEWLDGRHQPVLVVPEKDEVTPVDPDATDAGTPAR
jgi:ABC-type phosphate transport system substrate-binding protein